MPTTSSSAQASFRRAAGLLALLAGLAGFAWTLLVFQTEYKFRKIAPPSQYDRISLVDYGIRLERLLARDPVNGDLRTRYATVLGLQGADDQAIVQLQRAALTHFQQGSLFAQNQMLEKRGQVDQSEQAVADCLRIDPTNREYHTAYLRLLYLQLRRWDPKKNPVEFHQRGVIFTNAVRDWTARAPFDANAWLFQGNLYTRPLPLYGQQGYRCYLAGLAEADHADPGKAPSLMISRDEAHKAIAKLLKGRWAKAHANLS